MTEKFTPGPWHITEEDWVTGGYDIAVIQDKEGEEVLGISEWIRVNEPDLQLIADAWQLPDLRRENAELKVLNKEMYEALELAYKNCLGRYGISKDSNECVLYVNKECRIAKALRKARGGGE